MADDEPIQETEPVNPVEDAVQEEEPAVSQDVELDPQALQEQLDAIKAEKDLQHKRATKAEAELKKLKANQSSPTSDDERFERLELKTEGFSSQEVDFLMQNGGRKALDNKIVMAGIEAIRKEQKSKEATPTGTGKSTVYQKYTEADLRKMPAEELEKIIPQG